jgi:hypothetical protein
MRIFLKFYHINPLALERLNDQLRRIDFGLRQMVIEASSNGLRARFTHEGLDHDIFWNEESAGTKSFVGVFPLVFFALETGSIATIDELECNLHPKLVYEIVQWFYDRNTNKHQAQLLFTAHDTRLSAGFEEGAGVFHRKIRKWRNQNLWSQRYFRGCGVSPIWRKNTWLGYWVRFPTSVNRYGAQQNIPNPPKKTFWVACEGKGEMAFVAWLNQLAKENRKPVHLRICRHGGWFAKIYVRKGEQKTCRS